MPFCHSLRPTVSLLFHISLSVFPVSPLIPSFVWLVFEAKLLPKCNLGFSCQCTWVKPLCKSIIIAKEAPVLLCLFPGPWAALVVLICSLWFPSLSSVFISIRYFPFFIAHTFRFGTSTPDSTHNVWKQRWKVKTLDAYLGNLKASLLYVHAAWAVPTCVFPSKQPPSAWPT